ncbi:hypothetical protein PENTCL1PPCAC_27990 [Pristionchus entomophagus]|uniref:RING-type domain-containing protein n=1 Tax=Pristionchus entomophagus TaxID=358040 RepID=A0AAV5UFN3_9BILA|nr:hypothetical protein PENTCL1PPCAC_27990 [Pristionchus entomophagus]
MTPYLTMHLSSPSVLSPPHSISTMKRSSSTPNLNQLTLSKKNQFGSLSKDDFLSMVSQWKCAKCELLPRQEREYQVERNVFVLECGHFICHSCREAEMEARFLFKCPFIISSDDVEVRRCGKSTNVSDGLPIATHIVEMRSMLSRIGLACHVCRTDDDQPNYFCRDLIHVCRDCTKMQPDGSWANQKIFRDPRVPYDYDDYRWRYSLLCLYCARNPNNDHGKHEIWRFDQHSIKTQVAVLNDQDKRISQRRQWHLSMLSREMMDRIMRGYLVCFCGVEYCSETSGVKPVILGCNHIVCSNCTEWDWLDKICKVEPRCPVCKALILWKSDPLSDLMFAASRDKIQYSKCEVCKKLHPSDRYRVCSKQFRVKKSGIIMECPNNICFDCILSSASKKHHKYGRYLKKLLKNPGN